MEHRTFWMRLDAQKDAQDFLLATVLENSNRDSQCCSAMDKWHGRPHRKTLLPKNLSALKKCTTSAVYAGRYARFAERSGCRGTAGHLRRRHVAAAGPAGAAGSACYRWKIVRNMQMHCGTGRIECSVRHLKRLKRRIPEAQRHTFAVIDPVPMYDITCLKQIQKTGGLGQNGAGDRAVYFGADRASKSHRQLTEGFYAGNGQLWAQCRQGANGCCAGNYRFPPRLHAPRGTKMLILPDGSTAGSVGGGIMEYRAAACIKKCRQARLRPCQLAEYSASAKETMRRWLPAAAR